MTKDEIMNHFTEFLHVWIDWAEYNAPPHVYLDPQSALCVNFYNFLKHTVYNDVKFTKEWFDIYPVLQAMFGAECRDGVFPFGVDEYERDRIAGTYHQCDIRLDWVRQFIQKRRAALIK